MLATCEGEDLKHHQSTTNHLSSMSSLPSQDEISHWQSTYLPETSIQNAFKLNDD